MSSTNQPSSFIGFPWFCVSSKIRSKSREFLEGVILIRLNSLFFFYSSSCISSRHSTNSFVCWGHSRYVEGELIGLLFFFSIISLKLIILSKNPKATANSKHWLAFLLLSWALGEGHVRGMSRAFYFLMGPLFKWLSQRLERQWTMPL